MNKVRLGDIAIQIRGVSYKPDDILSENDDNSIGILRANNIQEELDLSDIVYIRKDRVKDYQLLKKEDILICASSGSKNLVGKAVRIPYDLNLSFGAFCKVVRTKGAINSDYLSCFFQSDYYRNYISNIAEGANINNIKNEHIDNLLLNTPNESNQLFYSKILLSLFSIIKAKKKQIEKLDELIKSRFVEMFGDPSTNTLSWIVEPLSYHLSVIGGYAFKSDLFVEDGIPVLRIGNINTGVFRSTNLVFWNDDAQLDRYKMYPGDLVISLTGTVGKNDYGNVCILGNDYDVYYLNQRNAKLELRDTLNKVYLSELLKFREIKQRLTGISRGVRQANISNKDILDLCVPIPPIELQNKFADFVTQVEKQKATVQQSIDKLETLKKSLMQGYFG